MNKNSRSNQFVAVLQAFLSLQKNQKVVIDKLPHFEQCFLKALAFIAIKYKKQKFIFSTVIPYEELLQLLILHGKTHT